MRWAGRLGRWEQRGLQPPPFPLEPRKGEARPAGPPQVTHGQEVRRSPGSGRRAAAQTDGQTGFSLCSGSRGPAVLPPGSGLGHRAAEAPTAPPPFQVHSVLETRRLPAVFWALGQRARVRKAPDRPCLGLCWDQPSHTLPPAQRSACHGRVARADMSTRGAQDRPSSSVSPSARRRPVYRASSPPRAGPGGAAPPACLHSSGARTLLACRKAEDRDTRVMCVPFLFKRS